MDENRAQAYANLIQQLLSCLSEERPQILQDNKKLLDRDLSQVLLEESQHLLQVGRIQEAEFLINLSQQLLIPGSPHYDRDYHSFLMEVLQTVSDSQGNPQQVYPFLQQNLDKLDLQLVQILTGWANDTFAEVETAQAYNIAAVIGTLGNLIQNFPLGSRLVNLEIAIACYEIVSIVFNRDTFPQEWATMQNNLGNAYSNRIRGEKAQNIESAIASYTAALEVRTREAFPEQWAITQNNLATAYNDRIRGEKAQNIESAIASYTAALEVCTREAFPEQWAITQNNLAAAYNDRIRGEKAQNIESAIASYTAALEVCTRKAFPQDWAMTQNNLGSAYSNRIRGEKAENIESAIASFTAALAVYTREAFPQDWAMTQNNLGNAYCERIRGEKAQNIESAIASYTAALEVRTREAFPQDWAMTQNNLGNAYCERIRGEKAQNIESAIASYTAALEVCTRKAFPQDWAMTQNNLGSAYSNRIRGEKAENIESAIASFTAALAVYTREAFPQEWATMQNNLGNAYWDRIRGEKAQNIESAIASYNAALEVYTREAFPQDWAQTQNNLGAAYSDRIRGEKAENIETAIRCYKEALEIRTPSAFPLDCLQTGRNLGNLAFDIQDWNNAIYGYENAISAVEQSREWATSQRSKREILQNSLYVYEKMVQACIHAERYETALLTVERSKSRTLIELLDNANLYPKNATDNQKQRLRYLRSQIADLQEQLDTTPPTNTTDEPTDTQTRGQGDIPTQQPTASATASFKTELQNLQQQLDGLLTEIGDPDFTLTQKVVPQLPDFTQLLDTQTALIEWYLPPNPENGFYVFIVTISPASSPHIQYLAFSPEQRQQLDTHIATYRSDYRESTWQEALSTRLEAISQSLHLDSIRAKLPETIQKLILVPHCDLHLIPLHALSLQGQLLQDCYPNGVQYVPSCQFLERLQQRQRHSPNKPPFFAIQNPTEDLTYTDLEVEAIFSQFNPDTHILKRREATKIAFNSPETQAKLKLAYYAHFSCHGSFNFTYPLNSALILAEATTTPSPLPEATPEEEKRYVTIRDGRRFDTTIQGLTLKEIFANLDLPVCRLITLSACETGLVDTASTDEYIGLASGFLYAGAMNVVSSLWSVSDLSTAFLMICFYQELVEKPGVSVPVALKAAQNWLRTVAKKDLLEWISKNKLTLNPIQQIYLDKHLYQKEDNYQPFVSPFYWAAFCAIGQ